MIDDGEAARPQAWHIKRHSIIRPGSSQALDAAEGERTAFDHDGRQAAVPRSRVEPGRGTRGTKRLTKERRVSRTPAGFEDFAPLRRRRHSFERAYPANPDVLDVRRLARRRRQADQLEHLP